MRSVEIGTHTIGFYSCKDIYSGVPVRLLVSSPMTGPVKLKFSELRFVANQSFLNLLWVSEYFPMQNLEPVAQEPEKTGFFFGGDSYVLKYTYDNEEGRPEYIVYFWQVRYPTRVLSKPRGYLFAHVFVREPNRLRMSGQPLHSPPSKWTMRSEERLSKSESSKAQSRDISSRCLRLLKLNFSKLNFGPPR